MSDTHYTVLGVLETATPLEIKAAYRNTLKKIHPDTVSTLSPGLRTLAEDITKEIIEAYLVLSDASKRRQYDQQLAERRQQSAPSSYTQTSQDPYHRERGTRQDAGGSNRRAGTPQDTGGTNWGRLKHWASCHPVVTCSEVLFSVVSIFKKSLNRNLTNAKRIILAFLMAAILATAFTWLAFRRLRASQQRPVIQIVAAVNDLPAGVALADKDVALVDWPSHMAVPGSFTKKEEVLGHLLIHSLGAKEPILKRDLGLEGTGIGLSTKIPPGMRATAIKSNEIVGVAGFLYPGSHVDILCTINTPNKDSTTQTVLQDVEVLTAGQTVEPDPQGKPQQVDVVTLLLNPEDSQKLQLASTQGTVQFVLRNKTEELPPERLDQIVPMPKGPRQWDSWPPVRPPLNSRPAHHAASRFPTDERSPFGTAGT